LSLANHEKLVSASYARCFAMRTALDPGWRSIGSLVKGAPRLACCLLAAYGISEYIGIARLSNDSTYQVIRYEIRGNTILDPEATSKVFVNAIGPAVSLGCICRALASLRQAYRERGWDEVTVTLPEQRLTNGIVCIEVVERASRNLLLFAATQTNPTPTTYSNRSAPPTFEIRRFEVTGDTLLGPREIERVLNPATGRPVTLEEVRQAAASLQRAYRERGYVTVAVTVPSQRLTNATVRLAVTEGKLASIQVVGNRYFGSNNIARALPSLRTNTLLNSQVLQRELDLANQNRDRQIYPIIGPGPDPGTSALALRVKDRLPLHANLEMDNYSTPGTPDLRVNFAVQYNDLWQYEHQFGLTYSFSPQQLKSAGDLPDFGFNQPLISSYSAFYRIPIRGNGTVSDQIANSTAFGYQEATHQFRLPPAQAQSEWVIYASASSSDTGVKWSAPAVVSQNSLLSIVSQDSGENLTANQNVGSQFRFPLVSRDHSSWSAFAGADYKRSALTRLNTNNFFLTAITTNIFGAETNRSVASTAQPAVNQAVVYFPLNAGLEFAETDTSGSAAMNAGLSGNLAGGSADCAGMAYSKQAKVLFAKAILGARRDQELPGGMALLARANGQAATGALINSEQLAIGGINSARGYYEGDEYGDAGWCGSLELRSPYFATRVAALRRSVPAWVRASVFTDFGQRFLLEPAVDNTSARRLWGAGFGLSANINNHVDARMVIAWPLLQSANSLPGDVRAYFTIGCQF